MCFNKALPLFYNLDDGYQNKYYSNFTAVRIVNAAPDNDDQSQCFGHKSGATPILDFFMHHPQKVFLTKYVSFEKY